MTSTGEKAFPIRSVQALRAFAALVVVAFHSTVLWHDLAPDAGVIPWDNGNAGVHLFFVISGFIMVLSSQGLRTRKMGWLTFARRRLIRIVPLYWLATALKLVAITAAASFARHTRVTAWNVFASFLFIPSRDAAGNITPVLVVGWTLSFEMLFYAVFTLALFLTVSPVAIVGPAMLMLALVATQREATWPAVSTLANPIVLEFLFGLLLAQVFVARGTWRVSKPIAIAVGMAGLAGLLLVPATGSWDRTFIWGIAATAMLWASLEIEGWAGRYIPAVVVIVGEASYSLYLTHGFVLPIVGKVAQMARLPPTALGQVLVPTCLLGSTIFALIVHRVVELPMTNRLRQMSGDKRQGGLVDSQTLEVTALPVSSATQASVPRITHRRRH